MHRLFVRVRSAFSNIHSLFPQQHSLFGQLGNSSAEPPEGRLSDPPNRIDPAVFANIPVLFAVTRERPFRDGFAADCAHSQRAKYFEIGGASREAGRQLPWNVGLHGAIGGKRLAETRERGETERLGAECLWGGGRQYPAGRLHTSRRDPPLRKIRARALAPPMRAATSYPASAVSPSASGAAGRRGSP